MYMIWWYVKLSVKLVVVLTWWHLSNLFPIYKICIILSMHIIFSGKNKKGERKMLIKEILWMGLSRPQ